MMRRPEMRVGGASDRAVIVHTWIKKAMIAGRNRRAVDGRCRRAVMAKMAPR